MTLKLIKPDAQRITRRPKLSKTSQMRQLAAHYEAEKKRGVKENHFKLFKPLPGVLPEGGLAMDFDDTLAGIMEFGYQNGLGEGLGFMGYSVLSELMQRPEYRRFAEIFAEEMTRKFIRVISASDEDQGFRIKLINDALDKFDLKGVFYRLAFIDCAYGRAQLYVDMGPVTVDEARSPLVISKETVPLHSLVGFKAIEPMWTYPTGFNSLDPTRDDFYKPRAWYAMGKEYHATRMIPFVGREVPDMLKPVYQFGGLSLTQMVKPYVDNWIRTRQNVGDAIEQFAQNVLKTNLESVLEGGGGEDLDARVALYNAVRSARGTMVIDKETEDFMIASMPLGNLDKLQAQAQEQTASVAAIPLIKYLGITPSGLNASTDNEVRTFFDTVAGKQAMLFGPHMKFILDIIMQSELGEVNPDISFTFEALWQMSETERATMRSTNANTAKTYIDAGVVDAEEERKRLAGEEDGMYPGLDPDDLPEPPQQPGADPFGGVGGPDDPEQGPGGSSDEPGGQPKPPVPSNKPVVAQDDGWDDIADQIAADAEWQEHQHPRGEGGKFAKSAGGGKKESLSAQIKKLVYAGHSNETIVEKLGLPADKKHYPGWYKADLAKKALKSYQAKLDAGHDHEAALEHLHDHDQKSVLAKLAKEGGAASKPKTEKDKVEKEAEKAEEAPKAPYNFDAMNSFKKNTDNGMAPFDAFQELSDNHQKKLLSEAKEMVEKAKVSGELESAMKWMPESYHAALASENKSAEQQAAEAPKTEHPLLGEAASHYKALKDEGYSHGEALSGLSQNHKDALKGMGSQEIEDKADAEALSEFANQEDDAEFKASIAKPKLVQNSSFDWLQKAYLAAPAQTASKMGDLLEAIEAGDKEAIENIEPFINDGTDQWKKVTNQILAEAKGGAVPPLPGASEEAAAKASTAPTATSTPSTLSGLTKVGSQLGSNPGGTYTDAKGNKFYVKHSKSDDHAKNEVLAGKLYQLAGAPVLAPSLIDVGDGKLGTITPWATHEAAFDPNSDDHTSEAQQHFATHAWTGNWDAIGLGNDNQVKINGKLHTVDVGGALKYRAQGQAKKDDDFSDEVKDVNSLLDPSKNANAAHAFKALTTMAKKESAQAVASIPNNAILEAVKSVYGSTPDTIALTKKLIARKESVAMQLGANTDIKAAPKPAPVMPAAQQAPKTDLAAAFNTELHPDKFTSDVTKKFVTNLHKKVQGALASEQPVANLQEIKDKLLPKYGAAHKAMANVIQAAKTSGTAAPAVAPAASASKVSATSKTMAKSILDNLPNVMEKNKPIIAGKLEQIDNALKSDDPAAALKTLEPIGGSSSISKGKVNEYLNQLKSDHGVGPAPPPPPPPPPGLTLTPTQEAYAAKLKAAPPVVHDRVTHATDAKGTAIKAVLKASTADIPGDWYAKVTAKLEGKHDHDEVTHYSYNSASPVVAELDPILNQYCNQVAHGPLEPHLKQTLSGYQDSACYPLNDAMNSAPPMPKTGTIAAQIKNMKDAINKSAIPTKLPVWRGIGASFESVTGFKNPEDAVGKGFVHQSFASVSRKKSTSVNFSHGQTLLKFTVPAGTKGMFMPGQYGGEREIVLDSHSMFRIDKVEHGPETKKLHGVKHLVHVTYLGRQEGT